MKRFAAVSLICCVLAVMPIPAVHASDPSTDCNIDQGPCSKRAGDREIIFDISPKPVEAMKEITFIVHVVSSDYAPALLLDLSMPGMHMGKNEVLLKKRPDGKYSGTGVIPRCPSGRKLWQAEIDIPAAGKVSYRFNVAF